MNYQPIISALLVTGYFSLIILGTSIHYPFQNKANGTQENEMPIVHDHSLDIEIVSDGLNFPTGMAFLGIDDILVLEKNNGSVRRIVNGGLLPEPLLDINVGTLSDRGMLGMALSKHDAYNNVSRYIFLYFTETSEKDGADIDWNNNTTNSSKQIKEPLGNRLYRYELIDGGLENPKLLLDLPARAPAGMNDTGLHNGGNILVGPDENVYLIIGDVGGHESRTQNSDGQINETSVILRISQDGNSAGDIIGNTDPIDKFYAYGIRNSFGMDFDPVTGKLWDTENGKRNKDEINLVEPGFNSGWLNIQGMSYLEDKFNPDQLETFSGKGSYSDPEFVWNASVAPSTLEFVDSNKIGGKYENDMFVGDFNNGNIYRFDLNEDRTELSLDGPLKDKVAGNKSELAEILFAEGFGAITDIETGPDGHLYVLSLYEINDKCNPDRSHARCFKFSSGIGGTIFKISPSLMKPPLYLR